MKLIYLAFFIALCAIYYTEDNASKVTATLIRPTPKDCIDYYNECPYNLNDGYSPEDVENARVWLRDYYNGTGGTKPTTKWCEKLRVRRNIKCLSDAEKATFRNALLTIFKNQSFISRLTQIHTQYWIEAHKFPEGLLWHIPFMLELENALADINDSLALHYHDNLVEWQHADQSCVWDVLGKASDTDPNYPCINGNGWQDITVTYDGTVSNTTIPPRCIKREMPKNMTWEPPEWATSFIQMGIRSRLTNAYLMVILNALGPIDYLSFILLLKDLLLMGILNPTDQAFILNLISSFISENVQDTDAFYLYSQLFSLFLFSSHFKRHLETGGYRGDLSTPNAPNDPDFWCFHSFDELLIRIALLDHNPNYIELTYDIGLHLNHTDHKMHANNIKSDYFNYYSTTKVKESFELGWGKFCYIYDHMVVAIRDRNNPEKFLPEMYWRIRECLASNQTAYKYYFPDFWANDNGGKPLTSFSMYLPEVGNCNPTQPDGSCRRFIKASRYADNANNQRQYNKLKNNAPPEPADIDVTPAALANQDMYEEFIDVLNRYNCCTVYSYV